MADQPGSEQAWRLSLRLSRRVLSGVMLAALCLLATACSDDATSQAERGVPPTPIAAPSGIGPDGTELTLEVVDGGPATGLVITDHRGFAVYGVSGETLNGDLICIDECLKVWVPVTPRNAAVAVELDSNLYAAYTRPDGIEQATYADIPLYLWTGDSRIGVTGGAGVAGTWFALTAKAGFVD